MLSNSPWARPATAEGAVRLPDVQTYLGSALPMQEAEAEAIRRIAAALPDGQATTYLLGLKYLEALPKLAEGKGSTLFLPSEASGVLAAIGGLRQMLQKAPAAAEK